MSPSSRSSSLGPEEEEIELPAELAALSTRLDERPESLATGNKDIQVAALQAAKYVFDLGMQSTHWDFLWITEIQYCTSIEVRGSFTFPDSGTPSVSLSVYGTRDAFSGQEKAGQCRTEGEESAAA